jgi:hypothetical protein
VANVFIYREGEQVIQRDAILECVGVGELIRAAGDLALTEHDATLQPGKRKAVRIWNKQRYTSYTIYTVEAVR